MDDIGQNSPLDKELRDIKARLEALEGKEERRR
jgi:hypothetical protein